MNWRWLGILLVASATLGQAQSGVRSRPEFAVVSIKPNNAEGRTGYGIGRGGSHGTHVTLQALIGLAYRVPPFEIIGGPNWIRSDGFDVECKADDPTTDNNQLRLMLQSTLEDRFKLKLHRETRDSNVYALVVSKSGAKIDLSSDQVSPDDVSQTQPGDGPNHGGILQGDGLLIGNAVMLSRFATVLSPQLERVVIDRTGLAGRFDIRLTWPPDSRESPQYAKDRPSQDTSDAPSIFTAIQEQLGLKLESAKGSVDLIVIDHAEKPTEN